MMCSPGIAHQMSLNATLEDFMTSIVAAHADALSAPSVSFGDKNLYIRGILEAEFADNLTRRMYDLMDERTEGLLIINDKKLKRTAMRVRLSLSME